MLLAGDGAKAQSERTAMQLVRELQKLFVSMTISYSTPILNSYSTTDAYLVLAYLNTDAESVGIPQSPIQPQF